MFTNLLKDFSAFSDSTFFSIYFFKEWPILLAECDMGEGSSVLENLLITRLGLFIIESVDYCEVSNSYLSSDRSG